MLQRLPLRGKIRLRARFGELKRAFMIRLDSSWEERQKLSVELDFWTKQWYAHLRSGKFWNDDVESLLRDAGEWDGFPRAGNPDYDTIRLMEARAHGLRILKEVQISDLTFFRGRIVVDIGPGAVCFLETSQARIGIAIEPLAREFAAHGLLLPSSNTVYLPVLAEAIPLLDDFADVVVSRNNLDHVKTPVKVVDEVYRILKPGGYFILIVHLELEASITEPHAFDRSGIQHLVRRFETVQESTYPRGRTGGGETLACLYRKPANVTGKTG